MNKKRIEVIDYYKGISIIAIVLFHLLYNYSNISKSIKTLSKFGGAGVHVFIVCSGFGLAYSYLNKELNIKEFFTKRFIKIYIPYILVILLCFIISKDPNKTDMLLGHVFLYKMFVPSLEDSFGIQFWFMSTLFQLYLLFPLLYNMENKIGKKRLLILSIIISITWSIIISVTNLHTMRIWSSFCLQMLWEFVLGMYLASIDFKKVNIKMPLVIITTILSFIIYAIMSTEGGYLKNFNDVFSLISFSGICYILYKVPIIKEVFIKVSYFSYEIYLTHILVFSLTISMLSNYVPNNIACIASLIISLIISYIYHIIITKINILLLK